MKKNQPPTRNDHTPVANVRKAKWRVFGILLLLISFLVLYFYLFRDISLPNSISGWVIANMVAGGTIFYSYGRLEKLQRAYNHQIQVLEKQVQRDAVLAQLSRGFAGTQSEDQICAEIVARLQTVSGYDYAAVFTVDPLNGDRILRSEVPIENRAPTPVLHPKEGLSERPLLDGKLHYSPDITKNEAHVPGLPRGSEIDIPIEFDNQIIGIIVVESYTLDAFDAFDCKILTIVAGQAALALKNARLLTVEKNRRHQAEIMYRATSTLTSALELDQVLQEILDQLREVIEHDSACIFIQEGKTLLAMAARGLPETGQVVNQRFPADNKFFNSILRHKQPVIANDVNTDPEFIGWGGTQQTYSWMGLPLIFLGKVIGCLTLDSQVKNAYSEAQTDLAQAFANQAATAIENARIYQSAKDIADRQKRLHQLSQEIIRAGLDLEQIYQSVHHTTAQLMPADSFVISLVSEETDDITAVYLCDKGIRGESISVPRGQGLSGHIIETGKPFLAFDFQQEEEQSVDVLHFGSQDHIRSVLALPMRLGDQVVGMISAQTYQSYDYTLEDQQLLDMLAAYAAIAVNNARLFIKIEQLATTDSLTGAFNRRYFFTEAQKELNRARRYGHPIAMMMLDLDDFKGINDTLGHDIGDQALKLIVQRCQENIRDSDILARYGGDEFIILLPETTPQQARETAERLRTFMAQHEIHIGGIKVKSTISIGVAGTQNAPAELGVLLKHADLALYEAKQSGRNCVKFKAYPK